MGSKSVGLRFIGLWFVDLGTRRLALRAVAVVCCSLPALLGGAARAQGFEPPTVRVGVLGLFHPQQLTLTSAETLTLVADGTPILLDPNIPATMLRGVGGLLLWRGAAGRDQVLPPGVERLRLVHPATFTLAVPGKLRRSYTGGLEIRVRRGVLEAVVVMETERAVASVVAAESPPGAPEAALEAQAVAVRSFLLSAHRHAAAEGIDACDTTHCQLLREAPPPGSPAARATESTRGTVLVWTAPAPHGREGTSAQLVSAKIVPALYTRSCDGHTRSIAPSRPGEYPFYVVRCAFCLRHPERWSQPPSPDALPRTESERMRWNRTHPGRVLPSDHFTSTSTGVSGIGSGHGVGLCQMGAVDLARQGASFRAILVHSYPDTTLKTLPAIAAGFNPRADKGAEDGPRRLH